jgi:CBS domain containing-hemolysin-like protein
MLLFLILNALFVAAEYALVKLRRSRVQELVDKGSRAARTVQTLQRNMGTTIAGTQLGITLMSLALGWIGEESIQVAIKGLLSYVPGLTGVQPPAV